MARSGFASWFRDGDRQGAPLPPVWKMDMLVLLLLDPVVFLFAKFVGAPLLGRTLGFPFAITQFASNVVSVLLTGFFVPRVARRFNWWLRPAGTARPLRTNLLGAALLLALYAAMVVTFWRLF